MLDFSAHVGRNSCRLSRTESERKIPRPSGIRQMPALARCCAERDCHIRQIDQHLAALDLEDSGGDRNSVVLPAPFAPSSVTIEPLSDGEVDAPKHVPSP
jgi:hypothetical protein